MSSDCDRIRAMISKLRALLKQQKGDPLNIADDAFVEEGDWVYLIVTPAKPGIRAYDYVERLNDAERELRKEVGVKVLVVPAAPD